MIYMFLSHNPLSGDINLSNLSCLIFFSGKNIILCILNGKMPFKMHKIIFFKKT